MPFGSIKINAVPIPSGGISMDCSFSYEGSPDQKIVKGFESFQVDILLHFVRENLRPELLKILESPSMGITPVVPQADVSMEIE